MKAMPQYSLTSNSQCVQIIGRREAQEDSFSYRYLNSYNGTVFVVADGMGGCEDGEKASRAAIGYFLQALESGHSLVDAVKHADRALLQLKEQGQIGQSGGCTLVAALYQDGYCSFVSVGDSYIFHADAQGNLRRLNKLHTVGAELDEKSRQGLISVQEAQQGKNREVLVSAIHGRLLKKINEPQTIALREGERIILASDGILTLSEHQLKQLLGQHPVGLDDVEFLGADILEAIEAKRHPKQDNATVLIMEATPDRAVSTSARARRPQKLSATRKLSIALITCMALLFTGVVTWAWYDANSPAHGPRNGVNLSRTSAPNSGGSNFKPSQEPNNKGDQSTDEESSVDYIVKLTTDLCKVINEQGDTSKERDAFLNGVLQVEVEGLKKKLSSEEKFRSNFLVCIVALLDQALQDERLKSKLSAVITTPEISIDQGDLKFSVQIGEKSVHLDENQFVALSRLNDFEVLKKLSLKDSPDVCRAILLMDEESPLMIKWLELVKQEFGECLKQVSEKIAAAIKAIKAVNNVDPKNFYDDPTLGNLEYIYLTMELGNTSITLSKEENKPQTLNPIKSWIKEEINKEEEFLTNLLQSLDLYYLYYGSDKKVQDKIEIEMKNFFKANETAKIMLVHQDNAFFTFNSIILQTKKLTIENCIILSLICPDTEKSVQNAVSDAAKRLEDKERKYISITEQFLPKEKKND